MNESSLTLLGYDLHRWYNSNHGSYYILGAHQVLQMSICLTNTPHLILRQLGERGIINIIPILWMMKLRHRQPKRLC